MILDTSLTCKYLNKGQSKVLFLAAPDRMDTDLCIAQMQGKFKLICFPMEVGHLMHEDSPKHIAQEMHKFLRRFKIPLNKNHQADIKKFGVGKFTNGL